MRRRTLILALAVLAAAPAPAAAEPLKACVVAGCDEERPTKGEPEKSSSCPIPATLVCAGGAVIGGAVDAIGGAASAGVEAAGDAVMGGLTNWVAGGASWLLERAAKL